MQARLEVVEMGRDADAGDVSKPEAGAAEDEEAAEVTLEMRFLSLY